MTEEGCGLTFGELADRVDGMGRVEGPVVARTGGVGFFLEVLRGWRDGQLVIPVERDAAEPRWQGPVPEGAVLMKHTPGASGIPRGIFFNDGQVEADGDRLVAAMGMRAEVGNLGVVSMAHSYGFSNLVLPMILHGVPLWLAAVPFPRVVEGILREGGSMVVPAVPPMWRAWLRAGVLRSGEMALAVSAGAPLPLALERAVYEECGVKVHNFYGASECGGIAFDFSEEPRGSETELGTVLDGVEVRVGSDGRIRVESDGVAMGYDGTRGDDGLGDGGYLTRDVGFFDGEGRLHLSGTTGGAINVAGRKISPAKVEAALMGTGLVERVRVHGVASCDAERHQEIAVEVALRGGVALEEVKQAAGRCLEAWEVPRIWEVVGVDAERLKG